MMPNKDEGNVSRAHDDGGQLATPDKRLLASWQRSEEYGVSAEGVDPTWSGSAGNDSLFFQCGQEVLTGLYSTLANEPVSLMLTDANGLLLNRFSGDTSLLQALDKVHLAPGFAFSERDAGTNGMGLALADRVPTLVRAEEHYSASLRTYTCAAVPVFDPVSGLLEGSVNITTWSRSFPQLLLALAESAAGNTSALMLSRSQGRKGKPGPKGGVFRIQRDKLEPAAGTVRKMSSAWTNALEQAARDLAAGRVVAAVGEHGTGRATLLAQALRQAHPGSRIISAAAPAPGDVDAWLSLWAPELAKPATAVIVENVDRLPAWAAQELYAHVYSAVRSLPLSRSGSPQALAWAVTAARHSDIPQPLAGMVDTVISVPALRERGEDVLHLARYVARQTRLREISFTGAAERALSAHSWPDNIDELFTVIHAAAVQTETIDVRHLPAYLLGGSSRHLSRIEVVERDEIIRSLSKQGATVSGAAAELGISRATIYRRMGRLGITIPK
ncbi:Fis family transcriptional regulator [Paenarthrobacter aurescens]|nr:Fis family transcriptional regulator [Paenarthrobacter aurescens]